MRLKDVALERLRDFGDVWLALGLWRLLELDKLLERLIPSGREEIPRATVAAILCMARLGEPSSELHIEATWYPRTALDDLLGVPGENTKSSPATAMTRPRWKSSSRRWRRNTAGPTASG